MAEEGRGRDRGGDRRRGAEQRSEGRQEREGGTEGRERFPFILSGACYIRQRVANEILIISYLNQKISAMLNLSNDRVLVTIR